MGFTSGGYSTQRGLGRAQFRKLETVASRLSNCDHFYGNRFFQPSGLSPSCPSLDRNQGGLVGRERRAFTSFSALLGEASVLSTRRSLDKCSELMVAQCCQGIGAHRAPRRYVTGEEGDKQQQDGDGGERQGIGRADAEKCARQGARERERCSQPDDNSEER